jgi:hypothetical protein
MALPFKPAPKDAHAVPLDDPPSWPAVYSTLIAISFLLFSAVRLWQLGRASIKIQPGSSNHIKVVCDDAPQVWGT